MHRHEPERPSGDGTTGRNDGRLPGEAGNRVDVEIVGSGPNGLAAALELARRGFSVRVLEASDTPGGGCRTRPLAARGPHADLLTDPCAAVHPLALASPFLRRFLAPGRGSAGPAAVEPLHAPYALAHPLPGGGAVVLPRDLAALADDAFPDPTDTATWRRRLAPLSRHSDVITAVLLGDGRRASLAALSPADDVAPHRARGLGSATDLVRAVTGLYGELVRRPGSAAAAVLAGLAVHAIAPPARPVPFASGLLLAACLHGRGWPVLRGGSGSLVAAMVDELERLGGGVDCGRRVVDLEDCSARAVVLSVGAAEARRILAATPGVRVPRARMPAGGAAARVDVVLSGPVPWADARVGSAATVHLTGSARDSAAAEREVLAGRRAAEPVVLASQPWAADPERIAGDGRRVLWTYAHVPHGSGAPATDAVLARLDSAAPGVRDIVLDTVERGPAALERDNASYTGGDIAAGAASIPGMAFRFARSPDPYSAGPRGVWMASASTPPGPGVHGMAGVHAARRVAVALRRGTTGR